MNLVLSLLSAIFKNPAINVNYNGGPPDGIFVVGFIVLIVVAIGITVLIIFAVRRLRRIKKDNPHD